MIWQGDIVRMLIGLIDEVKAKKKQLGPVHDKHGKNMFQLKVKYVKHNVRHMFK